jgi:stearoyl-CoA desaturase (delta-9 desaturase)
VDTGSAGPTASDPAAFTERIDWLRAVPFVAMHLACLAVPWVGVSPLANGVAVALCWIRNLAQTGL